MKRLPEHGPRPSEGLLPAQELVTFETQREKEGQDHIPDPDQHLVEFLDELQILSRQFTVDYMRGVLQHGEAAHPNHHLRSEWHALFTTWLKEQKLLRD